MKSHHVSCLLFVGITCILSWYFFFLLGGFCKESKELIKELKNVSHSAV